MYDVDAYLPEFFRSLDEQFKWEHIEVILVDDGSPDRSLDLAREYAEGSKIRVQVLTKVNGGQATARNLGIEHASGEWITFPDPDDVLSSNYFALIADALAVADVENVSMITTRLTLWWESKGITTPHALDARFDRRENIVSLNVDPECIQAHVTAGVFRMNVIQENALRFRDDLRYRFEDGNFVSRYLLNFEDPRVMLLADAVYFYRQRADASSTVQSSANRIEKYDAPLRHGYIDVFEAALKKFGRVPAWVQNLVLYDQFWVFRSSQTKTVRQTSWTANERDRLIALLKVAVGYLDENRIRAFNVLKVPEWMRTALILFKRGESHSIPRVKWADTRRGLIQISYIYTGVVPQERLVTVSGFAQPRYVKSYDLEYVGTPIAFLRTLWVAMDDAFGLELNSELQDIVPLGSHPPHLAVTRQDLQKARLRVRAPRGTLPAPRLPSHLVRVVAMGARAKDASRGAPMARGKSLHAKLSRARSRGYRETMRMLMRRRSERAAAQSSQLSQKFRDAWLFMDRDSDANDSAEDLYRWVRENRPHVNSWFILRRDSVDWGRLSNDGFRLIDYGSREHAAAIVCATHLASSHADRFVSDPFPQLTKRVRYSFTFLQHGVIKGDISTWLNAKKISTFVTSTEDEYRYVSGPGPFKFSQREVRLTGLPRFDVLLERANQVPNTEKKLVLVMPTWRDYLVGAMGESSRDRSLDSEFCGTTYYRGWNSLLSSPGLHDIASRWNVQLVFMPHPNMSGYLSQFELPSDVMTWRYADVDVRDAFARGALLVTDYSSTAFNMAFLQRPVVYFQFDHEEYYANHTERKGYFEYDSNGFGPVVDTVDDALRSIDSALSGNEDPAFMERRLSAFPIRDGRNRERVFNAMVASRTYVGPDALGRLAPPDTWESLVDGGLGVEN